MVSGSKISSGRLGSLLLAGVLTLGTGAFATTNAATYDSQIQARVQSKLQDKKQLQNIQASVQDGVVSLQGTVDRYSDKLDAEKRARKQDNVKGVRDFIEVSGTTVSDNELAMQLAKKLRADRWGYGHVFNWFTVKVDNGIATIGGEVRNPVDKSSALALVSNTKGVKGMIDNVSVAPASIFDDEIRARALRVIYGDPLLGKYGMDPDAPIRIVVNNGHLALYGVVNSPMDRQIAGMRANQVFGAFTVENHLLTDKEAALSR